MTDRLSRLEFLICNLYEEEARTACLLPGPRREIEKAEIRQTDGRTDGRTDSFPRDKMIYISKGNYDE